MSKSAANFSRDESAVIFKRYLEGLSVVIRRAIARAVLRRRGAIGAVPEARASARDALASTEV